MLYGEGVFWGKPLAGTGALLNRSSIPEGFYCYDTKTDTDCPDAAHTVVLLNPSDEANGSVIFAEPLEFGGKDRISLESIRLFEENPLIRLESFMVKIAEMKSCQNEELQHVQAM